MIPIARTQPTPTIGQMPLVIGTILDRNARREARRARRRRWFQRSTHATRVHVARIGSETIESNLPIR